jgi:hypothetical protein
MTQKIPLTISDLAPQELDQNARSRIVGGNTRSKVNRATGLAADMKKESEKLKSDIQKKRDDVLNGIRGKV